MITKRVTNSVTSCFSKSFVNIRKYTLTPNMCNDEKNRIRESPLKQLVEVSSSFQDINPTNIEQQWATLPYPQGSNIQKQKVVEQPKLDPRETSVILFPGQGSQYVGMGKNLLKFPMARELFELSNYILGYDLLRICLDGPKEKLDQTKFCQPAVMVCSLAAVERLKEEIPSAIEKCVATAGFSLGEITALIFAGAIGFERGLQLVKIRAEAMQLASEAFKGGMVTVFYAPDSQLNAAVIKAKEWAVDRGDDNPECVVANYLYPDCKVISGSVSALEFLEKNYKAFKLLKVRKIPVSGAFHSKLMDPAKDTFQKALNKSEINDPGISVYSNVDGNKYRNSEHIRKQLPKQIVKPVKWEQFIHIAYARSDGEYFPKTYEVGPGTTLKTILKKVNAKAWNESINIEA